MHFIKYNNFSLTGSTPGALWDAIWGWVRPKGNCKGKSMDRIFSSLYFERQANDWQNRPSWQNCGAVLLSSQWSPLLNSGIPSSGDTYLALGNSPKSQVHQSSYPQVPGKPPLEFTWSTEVAKSMQWNTYSTCMFLPYLQYKVFNKTENT